MYLLDTARSLLITQLNITPRLSNSLERAGINTLGDIAIVLDDKDGPLSSHSRESIRTVRKHINAVINSIDDEENIHWERYCETVKVKLLPESQKSISSPKDIFLLLPNLIKEILADERKWYIVQRRYGLENTRALTLQELGDAFGGISRQRIDQLAKGALINLRDVLIEQRYVGESCRVRTEIILFIRQIISVLGSENQSGILETDLFNLVNEDDGIVTDSEKPVLELLFELAGAEKVSFDSPHLTPVWGYFEKQQSRIIVKGVQRIDCVLNTETSMSLGDFDILLRANKGLKKEKKLTLYQIQWLTKLCSSTEKTDDGLFRGKFEYLKGRSRQVERLLLEKQEPIHIGDLVREINHRMVPLGHSKVNRRNLANQLSKEQTLVSIGKSGYWSLMNWEIDTSHILDLMEESLITLNRPATEEEIYAYVSERRPVSTVKKSSIPFYLSTKNRFKKVDMSRWALTRWGETKSKRELGPEHVAELVLQIFRDNKTKKLDYKVLKKGLMEATGVSERQAQGLLDVNPVIKTERPKYNELYAILQPDYKEKLSQKLGYRRKKVTIKQKVSEFVTKQLESMPGQQMLLSELVNRINNEFGFPQRTSAYSYLYMLDFVERLNIPDSRETICRISGADTTVSFGEINNIASENLRANVKRAISYLNIENVDIGLFLLSKEFESVLILYIETAIAGGKFKNPLKGYMNLNNMIDFVNREGIVIDNTELHFLRQNRNNRAHGTMPLLKEREELMGSMQYIAGLYIHYIRFFDDLYRAIKPT